MQYSHETYLNLVRDAYEGILQLPAFQREFKWERNKIVSLYDSLRKPFPIGNFLFLETSSEYNLSPRPFAKASERASQTTSAKLVLDGQQRITAGISLLYKSSTEGGLRFFLNLSALKALADRQEVDYKDDESLKKFSQETDDGDNYMIATQKRGELQTMLFENHWLSTTYLIKKTSAQRALEEYKERNPELKEFIEYLIIPYFTLDNDFKCPVITLDRNESLVAVTRIFATINTTGKRLTPIEIVTATLYAHRIDLKEKVEFYHEASDYLKHMDKTGEVLLQTIALLSDKTPKKSLLPKTITHRRFELHCEDALDCLDEVGKFLTDEMGAGLTITNKLLPYDSILAPMAVLFKAIKKYRGEKKNSARNKLHKWFIGAALSQRYQEGVHNKQENDVRDILRWIKEDNDEFMPIWLKDTDIPKSLKSDSPNGARGRLIKCLLNIEKPNDALENLKIGYYNSADETPQFHHVWPKKFCTQHLDGWNNAVDKADSVLNGLFLCMKTNKKWDKMDPANQIQDLKTKHKNPTKQDKLFNEFMLSEKCVALMEKQNKTKADYYAFIDERFNVITEKLSLWGFSVSDSADEDDQVEDDTNGV